MIEQDIGDEIAAGAGDGDGGKGAQRVVSQDDFVGENQRRDGGIEGGRYSGSDPAGNSNAAQVWQAERQAIS